MDLYNLVVSAKLSKGGGGDHDAEDGIIDKTISGAYTNSRVTDIGKYVFAFCSSLTAVNFPNVTAIGSNAFYNCSSLTTASFPNATSIGSYAFQYCSSLAAVSVPNVTAIGDAAFQSCASLTTASFPNATSIGNSAFYNCSSLTSAYFLASSVASLGPYKVFSKTGSDLSIYVPASLVDSYKVAANWSSVASRITAYEG